MTINVGINGMGRIGRMVIRAIIESQSKDIKIKHINNRSNSEASCALIKYDSIHGKFNANLDFDESHLIINSNKITYSQESNIEDINWKKFGVDYVFECTGKFNSKEKLMAHINNGAKKIKNARKKCTVTPPISHPKTVTFKKVIIVSSLSLFAARRCY